MKLLKLIPFLSIILFAACNSNGAKEKVGSQTDTVAEAELLKMYGFVIDSFRIEHEEVAKNQNLSDILIEQGLTSAEIYSLVQATDSVFDVRKIRVGNTYATFCDLNDTSNNVLYFVYEINNIEYVVYDLRDKSNFKAYIGNKDVVSVEKRVSGVIESSLWNALSACNAPVELSLELSEVYAWTVDFFGLKKGDKFKVVYDELFVDSLSIGVKEIKFAVFTHMDEDIYAIPFMQDSTVSFFDSTGQSLRKAFLKAPLRFTRISSRYSNARLHPVTHKVRPHHGVDYAAPTGTPVMSIGDGTVVKKGYSGGGGNMVKIKHNGTYSTAYLHLSKYGKDIKVGARVSQGQIIGYVGSTGLATGPHLDFRVYKNGAPMNPLQLKSPPVLPVKDEDMARFNIVRDSLVEILNTLPNN